MKRNVMKKVLSTLVILSMIQTNFSFAEVQNVPVKNVETKDVINTNIEEKTELNEKNSNQKKETVNNYFVGTFRLYDDTTAKNYDFNASTVFSYDYNYEIPILKINKQNFDAVVNQMEEHFKNKNLPHVLNAKKINGTNKYELVKKSIGERKIDRAKLEEELLSRIKTADYSVMKIPFSNNIEAEKKIIKNEVVLLSSYTTKYNINDTGRTNNVIMSGEEIHGTKLAPNEKFYYNSRISAIYPRLQTAIVIVNNKFVEGVGGGLCQTSTTLFNAVLESGLQIDHRRSHTLSVGYVPLGRDAMVSDYNDFVFTNNFSKDIYIMYERTANDEITFKIYGNKADKKNVALWVTGGGQRYTLHRTVNGSAVVERFNSSYQNL